MTFALPNTEGPDPYGPGPSSVDVIGRYSKPRGLEKDLDQLQHILERATGNSSAQSKPTQTKVRNITRRLGQDKIDQLMAEYQRGATTIDLMDRFGVSKASVIHLLEANGVALRRQPLTREQLAEAVTLYEGGDSLTAVQREIGVPRESLRRALVDAGVKMRPRGSSRSR